MPNPATTFFDTQKRQEKRQEGKNEEKTARSRWRRHPSQPMQLMRVWGKKKRTKKEKEEQKKETGGGSSAQLPGPFGHLTRPAWIIRYAYSVTPSHLGKY